MNEISEPELNKNYSIRYFRQCIHFANYFLCFQSVIKPATRQHEAENGLRSRVELKAIIESAAGEQGAVDKQSEEPAQHEGKHVLDRARLAVPQSEPSKNDPFLLTACIIKHILSMLSEWLFKSII